MAQFTTQSHHANTSNDRPSNEADDFVGYFEKDRRRGDRRSQNAKFKKRDRRDYDDE